MHPCPCCKYLTLSERANSTFEICPVCFWEDDNVQNADPNYSGGANSISLNEAKRAYRQFGAIKAEYTKFVRKPRADEQP